MVLRLGEVEAMLDRALELDERRGRGSLHELRLVFEAAKPSGGNSDAIESSFRRALYLTAGERAALCLSCAEAIAVPSQDRASFEEMIDKALAVDADEYEPYRLLSRLAHRQARWLRSPVDDLFFGSGCRSLDQLSKQPGPCYPGDFGSGRLEQRELERRHLVEPPEIPPRKGPSTSPPFGTVGRKQRRTAHESKYTRGA